MQVLAITNAYPPHDYGGYEMNCRDVMESFRLKGHTVEVLTSTVRVAGVPDDVDPAVHRTLIPYWDWETMHDTIPRSPRALLRIEQHNLAELRAAIERTRPDVVSVWGMGGISLSLLELLERSGPPMVLTVANDWLIYAPALDGWSRWWKRWPLPAPRSIGGVPTALPALTTASVNFNSGFTRDNTSAHGHWTFPDSPIAFPGIDQTDFPISDAPPRAWGWNVLYVGRLDAPKGVETLLNGFAQLSNEANLTMLGRGNHPYLVRLKELAASLGVADRVSFSSAARGELANAYRRADVVVFPSEWEEPFGLVPLEAMACGVPVVSTTKGGSAEYLRDGENCVAFPAGDAAGLASAINRIHGDPTLRTTLVTGGHETARAFTISRYASQLLELHLDAAGGR